MAAFRYVVPALAAASGAVAQFGGSSTNSLCSVSATTTLQSQADATALSACSTFDGSIQIAGSTTDNIALSGIERITGDLVVNNATTMTTLAAPQLSSIGGAFNLNGLTVLSTLSFPSLVDVKSINWQALPALNGLSFSQGVQQLSSLDIENTYLSSLAGINLETADTIVIVNNPYLNDINMQLGNVTSSMVISGNGAKLDVQFPNLIWANNMTLRGCDQLSTPSLSSVNGSYGIYTGTFETYSAPNLTEVGGALSFVSNGNLNNISLPELTAIGNALYIVNDSSLASIDGFPALKTIGGNVLAVGSFQNLSLPALSDVHGAFNVSSTEDITNACNHFKSLSGQSNVIKGKFNCKGQQASAANSSVSGTSSGSSSETSKSSANLMVPGTVTGVLGVVAAIFGLL